MERQSVVGGGSTQINSAGIIFSSGPERVREIVGHTSITSVHSESALVGRVNVETGDCGGGAGGGRDVVKAASGYMMATVRGEEGEEGELGDLGTPVVDLPMPKELIEIRQRKKVRTTVVKPSTLLWIAVGICSMCSGMLGQISSANIH